MMAIWRALGAVVLILLALLLVGPFLVPIPPLQDTVPPESLADADSRFIEVKGLRVHYKMAGQGEPVFVLLHGFGASLFSWHEVMAPLAQRGVVIAYDRPAFGLTARPLPGDWHGTSPYAPEAQADQLVALLDKLGIKRAILVGNSAGGTIAVYTAIHYPERVQGLVLVDAAIYAGGGSPASVRPLLRLPQARRLGPLFVRSIRTWGQDFLRSAWHDPSKITPEIEAGYARPLRVQNWDRALWELTVASHELNLATQLTRLRLPTLVVTGDDDRIVPTAQSLRLARELPGAELVVIPQAGHVPHEERPDLFMQAVEDFASHLSR